jgi:hypothetical protein
MKLYAEVDAFLSRHSGSDIRMISILRGIATRNRLQVHRVLQAMTDCHRVERNAPDRRGCHAVYRLKVCH